MSTVKECRDKILELLGRTPGQPIDRNVLKSHLGIPAEKYSAVFEQALKSKRITTHWHRPPVTMNGRLIGYMRPAAVAFSINA